jgi:hypothetical protein
MDDTRTDSPEINDILNDLERVKIRLEHVEKVLKKQKRQKLKTKQTDPIRTEEDFDLKFSFNPKGSIEFRIGEYGMAWLGNIVLFLGVTFLVGYLHGSGNLIFSALVGYITVAGIYAGSYFIRKTYSYLSLLLAYNGHLLLFYLTLRLHFFQANPLIKNETLGLLLLFVVLIGLAYKAFREKSQLLAGIVLLMILIFGIISDLPQISALITAITALIVIFLYFKFGWKNLVFIFIFLTYLVHLNWLLNNPLIGNNMEFIKAVGLNPLYILATGFFFSLLALLPKKEEVSDNFIISSIVWNGLGFTILLFLNVATYYAKNYVPVCATIAVFCLIYSLILQSRALLKITASMYALYSFLAMSVAFYGIFGLPKAYLLLSLQSLLVVSMALWFRSRFIVVMNTILYLGLMVFYLNNSEQFNTTNFSFMLVAFISARVINWKKDRLKIKTEVIRNLYLIAGFIMTLVAFYHACPASYITASWIFAAVLFFLLSLLIKNIKYRWLAIAMMITSAVRLIFVDMSSINIGYRVLVFLALAIISILISILYTKHFKREKD